MQIHNLNIYCWAKFVDIFIGGSNLDDDAMVLMSKKIKEKKYNIHTIIKFHYTYASPEKHINRIEKIVRCWILSRQKRRNTLHLLMLRTSETNLR